MKKFKVKYFYICIFLLCMTGCYFGLSDLDYYWQTELGKAIVTKFDFNHIYDLVWGTEGLSEYLDHEWLCNVLFYLFSLIPYRALFFLKSFICALTGLSFVYLIRSYNKELGVIKQFEILFVILVYATVLTRVKAFNFSVMFLIIELILLNDYCKKESKLTFIKLLFLCILWNNVHSGSIPVFFMVAGAYWLTAFKFDKKVLAYGVVCVLSLLLNPYGYKLIVFDVTHSMNKNMKTMLLDWQSIDAKTALGMVICLIMLLFMLNIYYTGIKSKVIPTQYILLSCIFFVMCLSSQRHIIYYIPVGILIIMNSNLFCSKIQINYKLIDLGLLILSIALFCVILTEDSDTFKKEYCDNFVPQELYDLVVKTNKEDSTGLYMSEFAENVFVKDGVKSYGSGAYPMISERAVVQYVMDNRCNDNVLEYCIKQNGFTKFLVPKINTTNTGEYVILENNIYYYLRNNEDYKKLYEDDNFAYFVRKDLVE